MTQTNPSLDVRVSENRETQKRWTQNGDKGFLSVTPCVLIGRLSTCTSHYFTSSPLIFRPLNPREVKASYQFSYLIWSKVLLIRFHTYYIDIDHL